MSSSQPAGFLAVPSGGEGPGVLVLHAWWGLNDTIRAVCRQLAEAGFTAFAPDLYDGRVVETLPEAEAMAQALDAKFIQARAQVADAARFLAAHSGGAEHGIAVIGFSLGAFYALDLAATSPDTTHSVVVFYGTGCFDPGQSRAGYLGHFAEHDLFEPQSNVDDLEQALRLAGCPVTFYGYPATGHWFFEPDRTDAYNPPAAQLAWERTLDFLRRPEIPVVRGKGA